MPACMRWAVLGLLISAATGSEQGSVVTIGLFNESQEPWFKYHPELSGLVAGYSGIVPDMLIDMFRLLPFDNRLVPMDLAPSSGDNEWEHFEREMASGKVDLGLCDANWAWASSFPSTGTEREPNLTNVAPLLHYSMGVIIRARIDDDDPALRVLLPFTAASWYTILGSVAFLSFVLHFVDTIPSERMTVEHLGRSTYHSFAALLSLDDGNERLSTTNAGRLLRVFCLFLFLIVQETYTANLASLLTTNEILTEGPKTLTELRKAKVCVQQYYQMYTSIGEYFDSPETQLVVVAEKNFTYAIEQCERKLQSGEVDAIVESSWFLHYYIISNGACNRLHLVPDLELMRSSWWLYTGSLNQTVRNQIGLATVFFMGTRSYSNILSDHFLLDSTCGKPRTASQVQAEHLTLVVIVFGCGVFLSLGLTLWLHMKWKGRKRTVGAVQPKSMQSPGSSDVLIELKVAEAAAEEEAAPSALQEKLQQLTRDVEKQRSILEALTREGAGQVPSDSTYRAPHASMRLGTV